MEWHIVIILSLISFGNAHLLNLNINLRHPAIDYNLHEEVLDAVKCEAQIDVLNSNPLLMLQFFDAGIKLPKGMTTGNFRNMGNYHQCLGINHDTGEELIQGKYCRLNIPLSQDFALPFQSNSTLFDLTAFDKIRSVDNETIAKAEEYYMRRAGIMTLLGLHDERTSKTSLVPILQSFTLDLAMCIPRVCSTEQAISSLVGTGLTYRDIYCRLPDDKPRAPADTVATVVFSIIALLTILSTGYDLTNTFWLKNDPKKVNPLLTSFSVYTNGRRLNSFSSAPGMLRCIDGIRCLSMAWIVVAHSFSTENDIANMLDIFDWVQSSSSIWVSSGVYAVDTFFCLSGVVLVYTTADKMTGGQLLRNLPIFYLNRVLRLWPILAFAILLQVSYLNRVYDGPVWTTVETQTNNCRSYWWLTLLFVQNYVNGNDMCIAHSWYIAIDFHCYVLSPLILYWVLGRSRKSAWIALTTSCLAILTVSTTYILLKNFDSSASITGGQEAVDYMRNYYTNTLTRAAPFFVGMIAGYVLHLNRGKKLDISWVTATILWVAAATVSTTIFCYPVIIKNLNNPHAFLLDIRECFMMPAWAVAISWMIVACENGYGGPVNWFLSLDIWRLPARLAFAVYVLHYPLMFVINSALSLDPIYFTVPSFTFKALAHLTFSLIVAYAVTLIIDAPCSTLSKLLLGGNKKKPAQSIAPKHEEAEIAVKYTDNGARNGLDEAEIAVKYTDNGAQNGMDKET